MHDMHGRNYLRCDEVKEGITIETDNCFICCESERKTVMKDENGFYFKCSEGKHYIADQTEDNHHLGLYLL